MLSLLVLLFAAPTYAQSLGDLARQERERKMNQPSRATHVYTNDDLAKPQILVPEDQKRVETKEETKPAADKPSVEDAGSQQPQADKPAAQDAGERSQPDGLPLGDIARHYRALKETAQKNEPTPTVPQRELTLPSAAHVSFPAYGDFSRFDVNVPLAPAPVKTAESFRKLAKGLPADTKVGPAGKAARGEEITGGARIRVRAGDTLWRLARKYLGRGEDWMLLATANPQVGDPTRMRAGTWVRLPDRAAALAFATPTNIRVARGDTLWKLSRAYLGNGAAWQCMAQANPQIRNSDVIVTGQTLKIPQDCAVHPAT